MTEKQTAYMTSNFERRPDDFYPTIDSRCIDGLLHFFPFIARAVDICAPSGSGIVDRLLECNRLAWGVGDAFTQDLYKDHLIKPDWIVTNTPYDLSIVDRIINRQIQRIEDQEVIGAAFLLRTGFDHAGKRREMFSHPSYMGQIKLCFRPWWTESRDKTPFHSYAWQIFGHGDGRLFDPVVLHYYPAYDKRYAADVHKFKCRSCGAKVRIKFTSQDRVSTCSACGDPSYLIEVKGFREIT